MIWLQSLLAVGLLTAAIFGWVFMRRKLRGDETPLLAGRRRKRSEQQGENELEAFIAAYREGKIDPMQLASGEDGVDAALAKVQPATAGLAATAAGGGDSTPATPAIALVIPAAAPAPAATTTTPASAAPTPLLRPEVKLAYLTFRSGLRDHHVFPNVRLGDLGYGVAVGTVDLLICDPSFKYVAAVDVGTGDKPDDAPKSMFLNRAGINHLTLSTKSMPKPAQLRELIYGKATG